MKKISQLAALLASLVVPLFVAAQAGINTDTVSLYSTGIKNVINNILVPVLMALAFLVFLWGVYRFFILGASNEGEKGEGRKFALWGIIGFVIILSIWGIVNLFMNTLGLSVGTPPPFPTINGSTGGGGMTTAQVNARAAVEAARVACDGSGSSNSAACNTFNQLSSTYNTQYPAGIDNGMGFADGSTCNADWQCANGSSCLNNVCASGMGVSDGSACTSDWQCANGSSCLNNVCASGMGVSDGSACTSDWQCANGSSCLNDVCVASVISSVNCVSPQTYDSDTGTCVDSVLYGCTDPGAINYQGSGPCEYNP